MTPEPRGPDAVVLAAFAGGVVIGGVNFLAVGVSNRGFAPFWGATMRFGAAALLFLAFALARGIPLPKGRALVGAVAYGALGFGGVYAFLYWALLGVGPGLASVLMSLVPLLTLVFAIAHGLERFRWLGLVGALVAAAGVAVVFLGKLGGGVSVPHALAVIGGAACAAESGVVAKRFPRSHPAATNAVGMATGAAILLALSLVAKEPLAIPRADAPGLALAYLVAVGSLGLFGLYLFVLGRWTASATSYIVVLMPVVAIPLGALVAGERIGGAFVAGAVLVVLGVWLGAFARRAPAEGLAKAALAGTR